MKKVSEEFDSQVFRNNSYNFYFSLSVATTFAATSSWRFLRKTSIFLTTSGTKATGAGILGPNKHNSICQLRIFQSHNFSTSNAAMDVLKIAIIGQSQFAAEVYNKVKKNGHEVVGIFTIPDKNGREDPVATTAAKDGVKVFKFKSWRKKVAPGKFEVLPAVLDQYKSVNANVNVMPFCSQFIPME